MINERRQNPRYHAQIPVFMVFPDGHRMAASTLDLSNQGVRLVSNKRLPAGIQLQIELLDGRQTPAIQLSANTLHSRKLDNNEGYGIGLQFDNPPARYKGLLLSLAPDNRLN